MLRDEGGIDETVQRSVQHAEHVSLLPPSPVVLHHLVRRQHVGADLVAEGVVSQAGRVRVALGLSLFLLSLEDLPGPDVRARADANADGAGRYSSRVRSVVNDTLEGRLAC